MCRGHNKTSTCSPSPKRTTADIINGKKSDSYLNKRRVRFSGTEIIHVVPARSEMTPDEENDQWYGDSNYSCFLIDAHKSVSEVRNDEKKPEHYLTDAYKQCEKNTCNLSMAIKSLEKWTMPRNKAIESSRGLEQMCDQKLSQLIDCKKNKALRIVLQEQQRSRTQDLTEILSKDGVEDRHEKIRILLEKVTRPSKQFALAMAAADAASAKRNDNVTCCRRDFCCFRKLKGIFWKMKKIRRKKYLLM